MDLSDISDRYVLASRHFNVRSTYPPEFAFVNETDTDSVIQFSFRCEDRKEGETELARK